MKNHTKHKLIFTKLRDTNCDRGCCPETFYRVECACGHLFYENHSGKDLNSLTMVDHRLDKLEELLEKLLYDRQT